ncbi:MAG: Uma2 family endonuclease [Blastocatellales bacterium]|nr:Uma2 family endonuclease [Blastocatellales bacterium]
MNTTIQIVTAEDLMAMSSDSHFELVKGELRPMSAAGSRHGRIISRIAVPMGAFADKNRLGEIFGAETGFILATNPDTVRAPDIAFVRTERLDAVGDIDEYWPGPPDLAVEVISPNDRIYELDEKIDDYIASGVRAVWIVNPKRRTVTVHHPGEAPIVYTEADLIEGGEILPGFSIAVAGIFNPR